MASLGTDDPNEQKPMAGMFWPHYFLGMLSSKFIIEPPNRIYSHKLIFLGMMFFRPSKTMPGVRPSEGIQLLMWQHELNIFSHEKTSHTNICLGMMFVVFQNNGWHWVRIQQTKIMAGMPGHTTAF